MVARGPGGQIGHWVEGWPGGQVTAAGGEEWVEVEQRESRDI